MSQGISRWTVTTVVFIGTLVFHNSSSLQCMAQVQAPDVFDLFYVKLNLLQRGNIVDDLDLDPSAAKKILDDFQGRKHELIWSHNDISDKTMLEEMKRKFVIDGETALKNLLLPFQFERLNQLALREFVDANNEVCGLLHPYIKHVAGLTDRQVADLEEIKSDFQGEKARIKKELDDTALQIRQEALRQLMDQLPPEKQQLIRQKLGRVVDLQIRDDDGK